MWCSGQIESLYIFYSKKTDTRKKAVGLELQGLSLCSVKNLKLKKDNRFHILQTPTHLCPLYDVWVNLTCIQTHSYSYSTAGAHCYNIVIQVLRSLLRFVFSPRRVGTCVQGAKLLNSS